MMRSVHIILLFTCVYTFLISGCNRQPESVLLPLEPLRNVVVIIGDDHANHALGSLGNNGIRTPNLDRLSQQGILFSNAFANSPLCSASRQSMLTGKYPHASGVTLLTTSFPEEQITIADHLKNFGFNTGIIGKNHFNNNLNHGFDVKIERSDYIEYLENNPPGIPPDSIKIRPAWKPFSDHARIWLNADALPSAYYDRDDIGTYYARNAIDFIKNNKDNRFCLWVGFHEPHSPFNFPVEYRHKYNPDGLPLPQGSPEDDEFIPLVFNDLTDTEKKGIISAYYTSVEYLDKNIGLILNGIEDAGLTDNTLVVYLGDHGYLLNHHKRFEKHMMWEEAVKAPLIVRAGSYNSGIHTRNELVEFVDIAPTITDLLGLAPLEKPHGKSLLPFFHTEVVDFKEVVFSEFLADNKAMVRTNEWKYIFTSGKHDLAQGYATGHQPTGIRHRLYNLYDDPYEGHDVSKLSVNKDIVKKMQLKMIEIFKKTHPNTGNLPEGLSIDQQLVWFCEPPDANPDLHAK